MQQHQTAMLNNRLTDKGSSLVEVMLSLVILLIVFLALMQTALLSIDSNVKNLLRDEAVGIAEMRMSAIRNTPFASLTAGTTTATDNRNVRNAAVTYTSTTTITSLNTDNMQATISVAWTWKGQNYTHSISTIVRSQ